MNNTKPGKNIVSLADKRLTEYKNDHRDSEDMDEWFAIDSNWDLNIYGFDGYISATLYPVFDGIIHTEKGFNLESL